jgi:peptide/nickel transport system permease protein
MRQFAARRLLLMIPTLLLVTIVTFSLVRLIPGDVVTLMLQEQQYAQDIAELRHKLGLDIPIHEQYAKWMWGLFRGDFGVSLWTGRSMWDEFSHRIPVSFELGILTMILSWIVSISIGVIAALRQDTFIDYFLRIYAIGTASIPSFWLATLIIVLPSIYFRWSPPLEWVPFTKDPLANLKMIAIPCLMVGLNGSAGMIRMVRAMLLEVLRQDYIRTAWAKGLKESTIVFKHAMKNALIPVVTMFGGIIGGLIGGSVIIEQIFGLPGMGRFMLQVVNQRDYPMLQIINLFFACIIVVSNLIVDLSYGWLDPRIRYR